MTQSTPTTMILTTTNDDNNSKDKDNDSSVVFPDLPLVCLSTAKDLTILELVKGKNVVIDFWTTRCTRCPKALDRLDRLAAEKKQKQQNCNDNDEQKVTFVSICCDQLDGAREIVEKDDEPKWPNIQHYYMDPESKEIAKSVLGFTAVPFYVMVNALGNVTQMGNKVDWTQLPSSSSSLSSSSSRSSNSISAPTTSPPVAAAVAAAVAASVSKTQALDTPSLDQENQPVQQQPAATTTTTDHATLLEKEATASGYDVMVAAKEPVAAAAASFTEQAFVLDDLDF